MFFSDEFLESGPSPANKHFLLWKYFQIRSVLFWFATKQYFITKSEMVVLILIFYYNNGFYYSAQKSESFLFRYRWNLQILRAYVLTFVFLFSEPSPVPPYTYTREELFIIRDLCVSSPNPDILKNIPQAIRVNPMPKQNSMNAEECLSLTEEDEVQKLQEIMEESDYYNTAQYMSFEEKIQDPISWDAEATSFEPLTIRVPPVPPPAYVPQTGATRGPYMSPAMLHYQSYEEQEAATAMARLSIVLEEAKFNSVASAALEPYDHVLPYKTYVAPQDVEEIVDEEM